MNLEETRERARKAREAGPLGQGSDVHRLEWKMPGTRRVWNVVLASLFSLVGMFPLFMDSANWISWSVLGITLLLATIAWAALTTKDLTLAVEGNALTWKRGRTKKRIALQQIQDVRWEQLKRQPFTKGGEGVYHARLVLQTETETVHVDGLSVASVEEAAKELKHGELLAPEDYERLCDAIRTAAQRARQLGSESDVPQAMQQLQGAGERSTNT